MSEPTVATVTAETSRPWHRFAHALAVHEKWVLLAGLCLQLGVLLGLVALRVSVLWSGAVYYVRVVPVDPRDLLRGDHVILSYEFSRPPPGLVSRSPSGERSVYVTLVPTGDGKHTQAGQFLLAPPADGSPFLKGRLSGTGRLEFGIESFFVQEGKGHAYEDAARSGRLTAEIAVAPDGRAAVRELHVGAK